jgi:SAM-dependent methyltransferase
VAKSRMLEGRLHDLAENSMLDAEAFRAFELAGWEQAAGPYADHWTSLTRQTIEPLLTSVRARYGATLLDVATGPGWVASAATERGARAIGIDFSPTMVALARGAWPGQPAADTRSSARAPRAPAFVVGDAEELPVGDATCDAVVMNFGMLHLGRPERAAAEARRVLRAGGRFAFTVWAPPEQAVAFAITLQAIQEHGDPRVPLPPGPPFFRFSDPDAARVLLNEAGFAAASIATLPLRWRLPTPEVAFDAMHRGTARTGGLLRRQTPAALNAIRDAVVRELASYRNDEGITIPMPAVLASAQARSYVHTG